MNHDESSTILAIPIKSEKTRQTLRNGFIKSANDGDKCSDFTRKENKFKFKVIIDYSAKL